VEIVGAEDRAFYLDPVSARKALRYVREDNPTVETQHHALLEAQRMAVLSRQRYEPGMVRLQIADPDLELEDQFTVDGTDYIVDSLTFAVQSNQQGVPEAQAEILARQAPPGTTSGVYDTDAYDDEKEYS
jgi:hypothetical protein